MDPRADNKINLAAKEFGSMIEAGGYLRGGRKWIKERNRKISPSFFWIFIYLAVSSQLQHVESSLHHAGYFVEEHGLSNCGTRSPECSGFSSCIAWAQLLHGMWDLSSLTRDWTCVPCIVRWILNCWTTGEVPLPLFLEWPNLCLRESENKVCVPLSLLARSGGPTSGGRLIF